MLNLRHCSHSQGRRLLFSASPFTTRTLAYSPGSPVVSQKPNRNIVSTASSGSTDLFATPTQVVGSLHKPIPSMPPLTNTTATLPESSSLPIFTDLRTLREWRQKAFREGKSVGFVPTMGALHDGHMSLVHRSLLANDLTVISIFVNPAQFAPHEDLATYPRTLNADLARVQALSVPAPEDPTTLRTTAALFLPGVKDMYPSGIVQNVDGQKGTFVEVKGYGHQMEGKSRPTFFRGVATVVTKLLNAVEPTNAYFGQKDIQQGLLLRRMVGDLLLSHPTPENLHIVPTLRSPDDGLALSSRNAYLSPSERAVAGTLYMSLKEGARVWKEEQLGAVETIQRAISVVDRIKPQATNEGIDMTLDYIAMNDPETFELVDGGASESDGRPVILSGALWIGRTRLIDNLILGDASSILT